MSLSYIIGIDTNIIIHMIDDRDESKHRKALEILERILEYPNGYMLSTQVIAETMDVILRKKREGSNLIQARKLFLELIEAGVPTVSYNSEIIFKTINYILRTSHLYSKHAFWDTLLVITYVETGLKLFLLRISKTCRY